MKKYLAYAAAVAGAFSVGTTVQPAPTFQVPPQWRVAHVMSVHDGDTFTASVDLGFSTVVVENFRLYGVDTPELKGESMAAGLKSRDVVRDLILDRDVAIQEMGQEKWGRWLARVKTPQGADLTDLLVTKRLGKPYFGGKKE